MNRAIIAAAALSLVVSGHSALANEFEGALRDVANTQIKSMLSDPAIVAAIRAQNDQHGGLSEAQIIDMDKKWRAEVGSAASPTIDSVTTNDVANMLRDLRDQSEGLFTEIFVMDQVGLNVASSDITSDYWQGDEAKFQETYPNGPDAVHISEVELDESTQSYQSQISVSITDPDSNTVIGAATFGVAVELLE